MRCSSSSIWIGTRGNQGRGLTGAVAQHYLRPDVQLTQEREHGLVGREHSLCARVHLPEPLFIHLLTDLSEAS